MKNLSKPHLLPYLDGLRGLAALTVFFGHSACSLYPALTSGTPDLSGLHFLHAWARSPLSLLTASNSAVCIFFVMSGFVMAMLCNRSHESFIAISVRRYLRLAGPAAGACIFSAWLLKHHLYFNQSVYAFTDSIWLKQWFLFDGSYHIALKEGLLSIFQVPNSTYDSSLWTMYIELWGSLGIFSLYFLIKNNYLRFCMFMLVCFGLEHYYDKYEFFCIFAGAASYHFYQLMDFRYNREWVNTAMIFIGFFLCAYPDFAPNGQGGKLYNLISTHINVVWYHAAGAVLVVHCLHKSTLFKNFFSKPLFLWLGKVSFSLYLLHLPIICSLGAAIIYALHDSVPYNLMTLIVIVSTGTVSLSLAALYTKTVDKWFIRFGHLTSKLVDRMFPAVVKTTSPSPATV